MKRLIIALAGIGISNVFAVPAVVAVSPLADPTLPFPEPLLNEISSLVSVPQLAGGIIIGGSGFYLQPESNNNDLNYLATQETSNARTFDIEPGFTWQWGVNVGYAFPNTGNDFEVRYLHFENDDSNSENNALPGFFFIPNFSITLFDRGRSTARFNLNQADVLGGQYINIGSHLLLHPVAGVRWANLDRKLNSVYAGNIFTVEQLLNTSAFLTEKSDFEGVGPMIGVDGIYSLAYGFGLAAHADSALLVGSLDANLKAAFAALLDGVGTPLDVSSNMSTQRKIVPALDGKLGLNYTYLINNNNGANISLEAGYQVSHYFNSIARTYNTGRFVPFTQLEAVKYSDMSLNGAYINLTLYV